MKLLSLLFITLFSQSYMLEYQTIMSRTSDNHGKGGYQIKQVLRWNQDNTPLEILETWTVLGESKMKLEVEGLGLLKNRVQGEIIYDGQKRRYKNEKDEVVSSTLPQTFSPIFFHYRYSKWMKQKLVNLKMAPAASLKDRAPIVSKPNENTSYAPENFLSLKRVGGTITYGVGESDSPSLYIEQDQFVVTKIVFPKGPSVLAEDYKKHSGDLHYPRSITYTYGAHSAHAKETKVTYLGRSPKAELFQFSKDSKPLALPKDDAVLNFYSTFR